MDELPEYAKREVVSCLEDLANRQLQEDSWLHGKPGGPATPSELVSQLFDDTALGDQLSRRGSHIIFSPELDKELDQIAALLDKVNLNEPPRLLLKKAEWQEVQARAAKAVQMAADILKA